MRKIAALIMAFAALLSLIMAVISFAELCFDQVILNLIEAIVLLWFANKAIEN